MRSAAAATVMVAALVGHSGAKLVAPAIMVPPLLWLVSDAAASVTGQRVVARLWDPALPPANAAKVPVSPVFAWTQDVPV